MNRTQAFVTAVLLMAGTVRCAPVRPPARPADAIAAAPAGADRVHTGPHFRLALPPGWSATRPASADAMPSPDGPAALAAQGGVGDFVEVWIACPETEIDSDRFWEVVADRTGRAVAQIYERRSCTTEWKKRCMEEAHKVQDSEWRELSESTCHECSAGDGRLDIWASFTGERVSPGGFCFHVGNGLREDASSDVLRAILLTFVVTDRR